MSSNVINDEIDLAKLAEVTAALEARINAAELEAFEATLLGNPDVFEVSEIDGKKMFRLTPEGLEQAVKLQAEVKAEQAEQAEQPFVYTGGNTERYGVIAAVPSKIGKWLYDTLPKHLLDGIRITEKYSRQSLPSEAGNEGQDDIDITFRNEAHSDDVVRHLENKLWYHTVAGIHHMFVKHTDNDIMEGLSNVIECEQNTATLIGFAPVHPDISYDKLLFSKAIDIDDKTLYITVVSGGAFSDNGHILWIYGSNVFQLSSPGDMWSPYKGFAIEYRSAADQDYRVWERAYIHACTSSLWNYVLADQAKDEAKELERQLLAAKRELEAIEAREASRLAQEAAAERKRAELSEVSRNAAKPAVATARAKNTDDGYAKALIELLEPPKYLVPEVRRAIEHVCGNLLHVGHLTQEALDWLEEREVIMSKKGKYKFTKGFGPT